MVSKNIGSLVAATVCFAAVSSPALADRPTIVYFDVPAPYTLSQAVTGCNFDVLVTTTNSKEKLTSFVDQSGDTRFSLITGVNMYLFTNLATGKSVTVNSSAPARLFVQPGDTFQATVTGTAALLLAPGAAPGFPTFALVRGRVDLISTLDFITLQINSFSGTVADVCKLLD